MLIRACMLNRSNTVPLAAAILQKSDTNKYHK